MTLKTENALVLIGSAELTEAKRIQSSLKECGITLELASHPEACGRAGGCKPKLEMYGREEDIPAIQAFFKAEQIKNMGDLEIDPSLLDEVFDPEKDTARCPACGHEFSTQSTQCPDCGLQFAVSITD